MDETPLPSTRSEPLRRRAPVSRPFAIFLLTAAATYVVAATLFVSPAPTRSVEAIVTWTDHGSNEVAPGLSAEMLASEDFLEEVLTTSEPNLPAHEIDDLLAELQTGLNFQRLATTEEGRARLGIQYRGDCAMGPDVVNTAAKLICERAAAEPQRLVQRRYDDLAEQSRQTERLIEQLQNESDELQAAIKHQEGLLLDQRSRLDETTPIDGPHFASDTLLLAPKREENPRWLDLQEELAQLEQRRSELVLEMSPLHPAVRSLNLDIADRQQQLADTQQYNDSSKVDPLPAHSTSLDVRLESELLSSDERRLAELEIAISQARSSQVAQQAGVDDAQHELDEIRELDVEVTAQAGPLPAVPGAGWAALVAIGLSLLVGRTVAKRATGEDKVFRSVRDAANALPVRIVGVIRSATPITPCPPSGLPRSIRLIRIASVGILAVAAIAMLNRMLASDDFTSMALKTPVRALAEAIRGLL